MPTRSRPHMGVKRTWHSIRKCPLMTKSGHALRAPSCVILRRYDAGTRAWGRAMRRREFLGALGCAALWPLAARAQQHMPVVGFLNSASPDTYRFNADSFREGLTKAGFVEGRNVRIEERWARGDYEALPALAAELVAKGVVAIAHRRCCFCTRGAACEQHGACGLYDRRRPRPLWTGQ